MGCVGVLLQYTETIFYLLKGDYRASKSCIGFMSGVLSDSSAGFDFFVVWFLTVQLQVLLGLRVTGLEFRTLNSKPPEAAKDMRDIKGMYIYIYIYRYAVGVYTVYGKVISQGLCKGHQGGHMRGCIGVVWDHIRVQDQELRFNFRGYLESQS